MFVEEHLQKSLTSIQNENLKIIVKQTRNEEMINIY